MLRTNVAIICSKYFNSFNLMFQQLFRVVASVQFELFMLFSLGGENRADGRRMACRGLADGGARGWRMRVLRPGGAGARSSRVGRNRQAMGRASD